MATKIKVEWVSESEAAALMGYSPKTLRRYATSGKLPINYTRVNYCTYEYNKIDIDQYKIAQSTLTN